VELAPYQRAWSLLPTPYKAAAVALALLLTLAITAAVSGLVTIVHDWRFDQAERERARERALDQTTRDEAIRRAEREAARNAVLEEQLAALAHIAEDQRRTAAEKAAAVERIQNETETAVRATRDLAPDDARALTRAKLRSLGFVP
jgi:hypothetical protein